MGESDMLLGVNGLERGYKQKYKSPSNISTVAKYCNIIGTTIL